MTKTIYLEDTPKNRKFIKKNKKAKKHKNKHVILNLTPTVIHTLTAVLKLPNGNADRGVKSKKILDACTGNGYVTISTTKINSIKRNILSYNGANKSNRKERWRKVKNDLNWLMSQFQIAANDDYEHSNEIIKSGGFGVKKVAIQQKKKFSVDNDIQSGCIIADAQGGGQRTCHDWALSLDNITFVRQMPTIAAKTKFKNLVRGTYAYIKHQLVTKNGGQGYSQVIKILVR